jgi:hypothetical protein
VDPEGTEFMGTKREVLFVIDNYGAACDDNS